MQGLNRQHIYRHTINHKSFDTSLCQEDGVYRPTFNLYYRQFIKAGEPFPLYRGKNVRWLLVDKVKEFIFSKN